VGIQIVVGECIDNGCVAMVQLGEIGLEPVPSIQYCMAAATWRSAVSTTNIIIDFDILREIK